MLVKSLVTNTQTNCTFSVIIDALNKGLIMHKLNLLSHMGKNFNRDFFPDGLDSHKEFKKILKKSPSDWIYRTKKITYSNNELGFRERAFESVDWNNSIVILGCSHVYGYSLAEEDTAVRVLEKQINMPVINLGVASGSVELAFYNSLILYEMEVKPKAIIQIWSDLSRYLNFFSSDVNFIQSYTYANKAYVHNIDWETKSLFYRTAFNAIWKDKTFVYEASFFNNTALKFNIDCIEYLDFARDNSHPGIISNKVLADNIASKLRDAGMV